MAGENNGVNLTTGSSEVHVYLHGDGSATWVERIELNESGAAHLRGNETLQDRVLDWATEHSSAAPEPPDSVAVEENALVVTYDVPPRADRDPGDVLVGERFHRHRSGRSVGYEVGADRAVLHAPDGMVVTNDPPAAERSRSTVVWQRSVASDTYVAFGPDQSKTTSWLTQAAIAAEVAEWGVVPVMIASFVSVTVLGFAIWALFALLGGDGSFGVRWFELDRWKYLACLSIAALSSAVVVHAIGQSSFTPLFWRLPIASVLLFAVLGWDTKREMGIRWVATFALVWTGPLMALGLVLEMGPGLPKYLTPAWSVVVSLVGSVAFFVTSLLSYR
jgi:hypothetical protein